MPPAVPAVIWLSARWPPASQLAKLSTSPANSTSTLGRQFTFSRFSITRLDNHSKRQTMTALSYLEKYDLIYLATPYSKYWAGMPIAFEDAAALAAELVRRSIKVYSPICHTHPIALYGEIDPLDHNIWLPFDEAMMNVCDALLIGKLEGWADSYGISYENDYFLDAGKPVFHLDPIQLTVDYAHFPVSANDNIPAETERAA
jgi:hypothetical protein